MSATVRDRMAMGVSAAIVVGSRWWAGRHATFPYISADEPAYLSMARWIAGRDGWNLGEASVYGPGYSLLIAPWAALDLAPDLQYRAAILTNVVLGLIAFVLLERLVRWVTPMDRPWSIAAALAGTMTASMVLLSGYAWSDSLAVVMFLLVALACVGLVERPSAWSAAAASLCAVAAFASHYRFAPLVVVVIGVLVVLVRSGRLGAGAGAGAGVGAVVGAGLVQLLGSVIHDRLYEGGGAGGQTADFLAQITAPLDVLVSIAGQAWYLSVTTAGLAVFGVLALVGGSGRRAPATSAVRPPPVARTLLALVAATFLASAVFMSDGERGDHAIYGRYNDAIVGPLLAIGLARLIAVRPLRHLLADAVVVVGATVACWSLVAGTRSEQLRVPYNGLTIRSLVPLGDGGPTQLTRFTVVGVAMAVALGVAAAVLHRHRPVVVGLVVVLALAGTARAVDRLDVPRGNDPTAAASLVGLVDASDRVAFVLDPSIGRAAFFRFPFYAPDLRLYRTEDPVWEQGAPWIMAPGHFDPVPDAGYEAVWVDPVSGQRLWRSPGR